MLQPSLLINEHLIALLEGRIVFAPVHAVWIGRVVEVVIGQWIRMSSLAVILLLRELHLDHRSATPTNTLRHEGISLSMRMSPPLSIGSTW